jgi:hypothetical protein
MGRQTRSKAELERSLGLFDATAISLGAIIGLEPLL